MSNTVINGNQKSPKIVVASLLLSIISFVSLVASIIISLLIESIGMVSLFGIVSFLAIAAIICGIIGRQKSINDNLSGKGSATAAIIIGGVVLFLTLAFRFAVFLFFIPWLGA